MQTINASTRCVLMRAVAAGPKPAGRSVPAAPLRAAGYSTSAFTPVPVALKAREAESRRRRSVKMQAAAASNLTLPIDLRGA